jgi:dynein heavy chain
MISYLGPFTMVYRSKIMNDWVKKCKDLEIPCSEKFSLKDVLGNAVTIR